MHLSLVVTTITFIIALFNQHRIVYDQIAWILITALYFYWLWYGTRDNKATS